MVTRLRELREGSLLTQQALADKSDVGVATIVRIGNGQVAPHFGTLRKLAVALGVEPAEIIADKAAFSEARRRSSKLAA
jgi:transcriptional regulator with XRE-family HTH domain